jgi:hypothetical protein
MKVPNSANAVIEEGKISQYLLNLDHKRGAAKAKLLHSLGYSAKQWQILERDIRRDHLESDIVEVRETRWGIRYDVVAPLIGPSGDAIMFRSVWQIDLGLDYPRLITMNPE